MLRAYNVEMPPSPSRPYSQAEARTERELLEALQSNINGAIVVTSTVRAARALRQRYNHLQRAGGNAGWMSPQILAWEPWLEILWDAAVLCGAETRVILTDTQELELWHKVLAQDDDAKNTLSTAALAELAQQAWRQMHQYRVPAASLRRDSSLDVAAFSRWAGELEKICRRFSFLSPALIEAEIAKWISAKEISLPENIFLVGFDRVTPAQIFLIQTLAARGCSAQFVELRMSESAVSNCAIAYARTTEDEIAATAHWIRDTLLANPGRRIGVIVPELEKMRGPIDATFRRVLAPSSMDVRAQQTVASL